MKQVIYLIMLVLTAYVVFGAAANWVNNPNNCLSTDPTNFPGQDCSPNQICGELGSDIAQCFDMSTLNAPSFNTSTTSNADDGSFDGGYLVNCNVAGDAASPFCDNSGNFNCDTNSTQQATPIFRQTICLANEFGGTTEGNCTSGRFNCFGNSNCESTSSSACEQGGSNNAYNTGTCVIDFSTPSGTCICTGTAFACDGGIDDADGCEISGGSSCTSNTGFIVEDQCFSSTQGNCTANGARVNNRDCDNSDSDGNQITCNSGNGCEITLLSSTNNSFSVYQTCSTFACQSGHLDCNGPSDGTDSNGCEITEGGSCGSSTGTYAVGQCQSGTGNCTATGNNLDCDNDDSDSTETTCNGANGCEVVNGGACTVGGLPGIINGCSGGAGLCVITGQHHLTNQSASGSSSRANLESVQFGTGPIANFTQGTDNLTLLINNSACIIFPDGTGQCSASSGSGGGGVGSTIWTNNSEYTFLNTSFPQNVNFTGNLSLGDKITFALGEIIDNIVDGFIRITGNLNVTGTIYAHNFSGNSDIVFINQTGSEIVRFTNDGNVGIGTSSPSNILVVKPTTNADKILLTESDSDLSAVDLRSFSGGGQITVSAGGVFDIILNALGASVFNDQGFSNHDFRVEGDTNDHLLFVDAGEEAIGIGYPAAALVSTSGVLLVNGSVGIGTASPTKTLHVIGDVNISGRLDVGTLNISGVAFSQGDLDVEKSLRVSGGANISGDLGVSGRVGIGTTTPQDNLEVVGNVRVSGSINATNLNTTGQTILASSSGNVGIGTTSPGQKLVVVGDLNVTGNINSNATYSTNNHPSYNPIDDQLAIYLPFSEGSGAGTTYDRSKYGNDGTLTNMDLTGNATSGWTTGKLGNSLLFDGINDSILVSNDLSFKSNTTAYSLWFYPKEVNRYQGIISIYNTNSNSFELFIDNAGSQIAGGSFPWQVSYGISTDRWYHAYIERNNSGYVRLYVNGNLVSEVSGNSYAGDKNNNDLLLGVRGGFYFNGSIDEAKVYTRALSSEEIRAEYLRGVNALNKPYVEDSSGNVGIGTTSPGQKLVVVGDLNVTGTSYLGDITLTADNITTNNIVSKDGNITFYDNLGNQTLRIDSSGNIGIGTSTPNQKLVVVGNVNITGRLDVGTLNISGVTFSQGNLDVDKNLRVNGGANITGDFSVNNNFNVTASSGDVDVAGTLDASNLKIKGSDVQVEANAFKISNYSAEYASTGYKLSNFTSDYDARTDRFGLENYSSEYASTGYKKENLTIDYPNLDTNVTDDWNFANNASLILDNDTIIRTGNLSNLAVGNVTATGSLFQPVYGSDDGLVLYMPFSEPNGSTQYDRSPYGNDGTPANGVVCNGTLGKYGSGCDFNGVDSSINISDGASLDITEEITVEAWVKFDTLSVGGTSAFPTIVSKNPVNDAYLLFLSNTDIIKFRLQISGNQDVDSTFTPSTDRWYHIAGTYDGADMKLYIDGALNNNKTQNGSIAATAGDLTIGRFDTSVGYFNGSIDEVKIYNRALDEDEIRTSYLRGSGSGASGAITADKFRIVNTTGTNVFEVNSSGATLNQGIYYGDGSGLTGILSSGDLDNATIIRTSNTSWWQGLYDAVTSRWQLSNFTSAYDARTDRWQRANSTELLDNDTIVRAGNASFVTSQNVGGEASGTVGNIVLSDTALDNQYVLRENTSLVQAGNTTFVTSQSVGGSEVSGTVGSITIDGGLTRDVELDNTTIIRTNNITNFDQNVADDFNFGNLSPLLDNNTILRTGNISNIRESSWDFANNDSLVLDNGTIIRTTNLRTALSNNTFAVLTDLRLLRNNSINGSVVNVLVLEHAVDANNKGVDGIGVSLLFKSVDNISEVEVIGNISGILTNTRNGSETSAITFSTRSAGSGLVERLRIHGDGGVSFNSGLGWANLTTYPSACSTSETITILGDTITCSSISITESQISDLQAYLINGTDAVFGKINASDWTNVSITESQISDLKNYQVEVDAFKNENFTSRYDARSDRFDNENLTDYLGDNASIVRAENTSFVTSQSVGGEVSGTVGSITLSDAALDDQYVLRENASLVQTGNTTFVTSQSVGGEVSGTVGDITLSDTALDDQYVLQENASLVQAGNTTFVTSQSVGGSEVSGTVGNIIIDGGLTRDVELDNATIIRTNNITNFDQNVADDFNFGNLSPLLDNATIIRTGNLSQIFLERNSSLWNNSGSDVILNDVNANVGIGTSSPNDKLEVVGSVRVSGSLNATSINASSIKVGTEDVQVESSAWKQNNFTSAYDARTDRFDNENFTTQYNARTDRFGLENYSNEYSSTGYKLANFTSDYANEYSTSGFKRENITDFLGVDNASILKVGNISDILLDAFKNENFTSRYNNRTDRFGLGNYSSEYASTGYKKENLTIDYPNLDTNVTDDWNFANNDSLVLDNDTIVRSHNTSFVTSNSGWTDDGSNVRLTTSTDYVGIGISTPTSILHVVGQEGDNITLKASGIELTGIDSTIDNGTGGGITLTGGQGDGGDKSPADGGNITIIGGKGGNGAGSGAASGTGGRTLIKGGEGGGGQKQGSGGDAILSGGDAPDEGNVKSARGGAAVVKGGDVLGISTTNSGTAGTGGIANITGGRGGDGGGTVNRNGGPGGNVILTSGTGGDATTNGSAGDGGNLIIDAGIGGVAAGIGTDGSNGTISIGTTTASSISSGSGSTQWSHSGDFKVDSSTLFVDSTNNRVGIGTTSPTQKLDVSGSVNITGTYYGDGSGLTNLVADSSADDDWNYANNASLVLDNGSVLRTGNISDILESTWNFANNASLVLDNGTIIRTGNLSQIFLERNSSLWDNSGGNVVLRDINANVGIGTTTPGSKLEVNGNVSLNNTLYVTEAGNVGIGTASPTEKLHLANGTFLQTPRNPVKVGGETLGNFVNAVYVSGKYAYVGLQKSGSREFEIVDILDPTSPTTVGSGVEFGVNVRGIYVSGKYAYVVTDGNRLEVIDISNPTSPAKVDNAVTADDANAVYVSGKYAYVGSAVTGDDLEIFDISDPTDITKVGGAAAADGVNAVYVSGKYAYVGSNATGNDLEIFDISDPTNPTNVGGVAAADGVNSIYVSGRYAYVGSDATGNDLEIFDISDPTNPTNVGGVAAADAVNAVYVSGKYAYVGSDATGDDLEVFDISDPTNPTKVGGVDADSANAVYVSGKYAYVGSAVTGDDLEIFDLGGIDAPSASIGNIQAGYLSVTENVIVGNNLYAQNGLNVGPGGMLVDGGLSVANGSLYVSSVNGNVGIGTTSPEEELHVVVAGNSTPGIIRIESLMIPNADVTQGIHLFKNNGELYGWKIEGSGAFNSDATLEFISSQNEVDVIRMIIKRDTGDVGIGTTSPTQKLDVNGSVNVSGVYYGNGSGLIDIGADSLSAGSVNTTHIVDGTIGNVDIAANTINTTQIIDGTIVDADISDSTNLTLGQKIVFALGGFIQNIISGQIDVNGTLNVTNDLLVGGDLNISGNTNIEGNLTVSGNIDITDGSLFQPVYPSDDGLILYMPFSEPNGSTQYDRSPFGNDGTQINGAVCNITLGKYGSGCDFNGFDSSVDISDSASLDITEEITIEAWVKLNTLSVGGTSAFPTIVSKNPVNEAYLLFLSNTDIIKFRLQISGNQDVDSTFTPSTDRWYHVAGTYDGADMKLYIDGALNNNKTQNGSIAATAGDLTIGRFDTSVGYFNGSIDEVKIYKRALTSEEIRTHYLRGSGFGASGAITADKFRIVNTSGTNVFEVNSSGVTLNEGVFTGDGSGLINVGADSLSANSINTTHIVDGTIVDADISDTTNLTLGEKIVFALGGFIQNIISGQIDVNGTLNVTDNLIVDKNLTVDTNTLFVDSDNNRVGIGTTSPTNELTIISQSNSNDIVEIRSSTNKPLFQLSEFGTDIAVMDIFDSSSAVTLRLNSQGDSYFVGGDVGIGTTSPTQALDVNGSVNVSGVYYGNGSGLTNLNGSAIDPDSIDGTELADTITLDANMNFAGGFDFSVNTSDLYVDVSTGRVGIGTAAPEHKLHVSSSDNVIALFESTDAFVHIYLKDGTTGAGTDGELIRRTGDVTSYWANSIEHIRLKGDGEVYFPNGNVGIGITSPSSPLHVSAGESSTTYPTTTSTGNIVGSFQNGNQHIELGTTGGTNDRRAWILARHSNVDSLGGFFSTLHLQPDIEGNENDYEGVAIAYNTSIKLDSTVGLAVGRNVGIGTTNPSQALDVVGNVNVSGTLYASNISSNSPLQLQTAGTTRIYINDSTGNVGIGTVSPTQKLHVNGSVNLNDMLHVSANSENVWNLTSALFNQAFNVGAEEGNPHDVFFKPDGLRMYIIGGSGDEVNEYNLSTAWDISSASFNQNFSVFSEESIPTGFFFKPDGLRMYIIGTVGDRVYEYNLPTAWDISSANFTGNNFSVTGEDDFPQDVFFKPDGLKMYVLGEDGNSIYEYNLSTDWDISSASFNQNFNVTEEATSPVDLFFKSDGLRMYILDAGQDDVNEYSLSTPWDISSASFTGNSFSIAEQDVVALGLFFRSDGKKMYVSGDTNNNISEYNLTNLVVGGGVGIGTTSPAVKLHVNDSIDGNIFRLQDLDGTCNYNPESGSVTVSCTSDEKLKENIHEADSVLDDFEKIKVRDYIVKASGDKATGVVAQEIQKTNPELVEEIDGILFVEQPNPWKLLKGIQELQEQINILAAGKNLSFKDAKKDTESSNTTRRNVINKIILDKDTIGQVTLPAHNTEVRVDFTQEYETEPIVTITPIGLPNFFHGVDNVTTTGFNILISENQDKDVVFNWHAFGQSLANEITKDREKIKEAPETNQTEIIEPIKVLEPIINETNQTTEINETINETIINETNQIINNSNNNESNTINNETLNNNSNEHNSINNNSNLINETVNKTIELLNQTIINETAGLIYEAKIENKSKENETKKSIEKETLDFDLIVKVNGKLVDG